MRFIKKLIRITLKIGLIGLFTLLLFEFTYRTYLIDFYKTEHLAINTEQDLDKNLSDVLIFGDSFSATSKEINYVDKLRESNPSKTFLNFSVPGIGIKQVNIFAKKKIEKHKPKHIVYQIYAGNDLLDVEKLKSYNNVSVAKYAFWQMSNVFLGLSYLNHKATFFKSRVNYRHYTLSLNEFSEENYNKRSKSYISINPNYIEQNAALQKEFKNKYTLWLEEIKLFLENIPEHTKITFVWIPHCTQVNSYYLNNFKLLGSNFNNESKHLSINYNFYLRAVHDLSKIRTINQINTLEVLKRNDNKTNRAFFANDPHLNKYGNTILANDLNKLL